MRSSILRSFSVMVLVLALASGCTKKSAPSPTPKVVHLAIWSNYLSPEILADFEKRSGIRVQVSHYSSNEELLAKLQAGASGYDVIVPSDYMVGALVKLGLAKKLDRSKLPHANALLPQFLGKSYDPKNEYSMPYDVGTTGIAVNRALYKGEIKGWKDLFEKPELAGKISLLDDAREVIGAALKAHGLSLNTKDAAKINQMKDFLLAKKPRVKAFTSETLNALVTGEIPVAHAYSSDALQARKQTQGKVEYILPAEGGTIWIDNLVIPSKSEHVDEAHALIDYLLEGKVSASTIQAVFVGPVNREAIALLPDAFKKEYPAVMAGVEKPLKGFEMLEDLGDAQLVWDRAWTEVKAGAQTQN